jgi:hypothetical protein
MKSGEINVIALFRGGSHVMCALLGQNADNDATYLATQEHSADPPRWVTSYEAMLRFPNRLVVIRDPRDICVGALSNRVKRGKELFPWVEILNGQRTLHACKIWSRQCQDEFIVRYEDLCRNPNQEQQRVATRFDIPLSPKWSTRSLTTYAGAFDRAPIGTIDTRSVDIWQDSPYREYAVEFAQIPDVKEFLEIYYG